MTGALLLAITQRFEALDGCEMSRRMPHLFASATTCLPRALTSLWLQVFVASPVFESESWL